MIGLAGKAERLRANELGRELFSIPAFEMLLDLYTSTGLQPRSLTSLTTASSASERNSQRIVHRMAERGLVSLRRDPSDGRRIIVELEQATRELLDRFFDQLVELIANLPSHEQGGS
ncbi:hypothetical protein ACFSUK_04600 [Sphingobium scionense]|jgi:DNA-binding MarR family transcriptional regulator